MTKFIEVGSIDARVAIEVGAFMTSIYSRLYRYRQREDRSPLENFLTEAIADYFNRMSPAAQKDFLSALLLPPKVRSRWENMREVAALRADTQRGAGNAGIIDLVISNKGEPIIAIENKISAPIRKSSEAEAADDVKNRNQLSSYGHWLKSNAPDQWPCVVVLLSHATPAPADFVAASQAYGSIPHTIRWAQVATHIRQGLYSNLYCGADQDLTSTLGRELLIFLEENGMASEFASLEDFSAGIVYLRSSQKLINTFKAINDHLVSFGGVFNYGERKARSQEDDSLWFDTNNQLLWGWKYLSASLKPVPFLSYGIALKPQLHLKLTSQVGDGDMAFVSIGSDERVGAAHD